MGTADIVTKEYMRGNAVFADAFNYLIYNGKKVIDPAKLKEIDPTEIALPFDDEEKAGKEKDGEDKNRKAQGTEWSSVKNESVRKKTAGRAGKKTDAVQRYRDLLKFVVPIVLVIILIVLIRVLTPKKPATEETSAPVITTETAETTAPETEPESTASGSSYKTTTTLNVRKEPSTDADWTRAHPLNISATTTIPGPSSSTTDRKPMSRRNF